MPKLNWLETELLLKELKIIVEEHTKTEDNIVEFVTLLKIVEKTEDYKRNTRFDLMD